jgi:hypothetical protein
MSLISSGLTDRELFEGLQALDRYRFSQRRLMSFSYGVFGRRILFGFGMSFVNIGLI